ncbi:MAG: CapA family protein [Actinomycetota bacterium]|nr:CapA family protein [Actinomycetota bacterium]MDQ3647068.1 CapA family protein [Actinomycetota bacterium]
MEPSPTIGLLGDVMLGRLVARRLEEEPPGRLWSDELKGFLRGCDVVICNLQCSTTSATRSTDYQVDPDLRNDLGVLAL